MKQGKVIRSPVIWGFDANDVHEKHQLHFSLSFPCSRNLSWLFLSSIEFLRNYFWVNEIFLCILNGMYFCTLYGFLEMVNTDPLDTREFLSSNTEYHTRLAKLYRQIRRTCLVRRANETGLRLHEHIYQINLKSIPAHNNSDDVLSDLRYLVLHKTEQAIAWLRRFLAQNPGKVLIFAHHSDVVEELVAALNLPAIYGKAPDKDQRCSIAACFIHPEGSQALIVTSDVELAWHLSPVSALVFVELWITPRQLYGFVDHILDQDEIRTLPVYLLYVKDTLAAGSCHQQTNQDQSRKAMSALQSVVFM